MAETEESEETESISLDNLQEGTVVLNKGIPYITISIEEKDGETSIKLHRLYGDSSPEDMPGPGEVFIHKRDFKQHKLEILTEENRKSHKGWLYTDSQGYSKRLE